MSNYLINIGKKSKKAFENNLIDSHFKKKIALNNFNQKLRQESNNILFQNSKDLKYAKNKKEAIRFLEFLTSAKSQETFGKVNYEYPLVIKNNQSDLLKSWGAFKADKVNLSLLGAKNAEAVKLFDLAGWE